MKKIDYFKKAMRADCYKITAWVISAFAITNEKPDAWLSDPYSYRLIQSMTSIGFIDPENNNKLSYIDDWVVGESLFQFTDRIVVDATFCPNAITPVETTLGNVIVNLSLLVNAFNKKIPFVTGVFNIRKIEDIIAKRLVDMPASDDLKNDNDLYIPEYIKFVDSLSQIMGFSLLAVHAATEKSMTVADDFPEFKNNLLEEYKGKLSNPLMMAEFENKLQLFDEKHLKDDPANGKFLSGKVKMIARKKEYLTMGGEAGFTNGLELTAIPNSLNEGWSKDLNQFVAAVNGIRNGSYHRGIETEKGGTSYKVLLRAGSNFKIIDDDCMTKTGIYRTITPFNAALITGRMILNGNEWQYIETDEEANSYIGKSVILRSPMFCLENGDRICRHCAGKKLALNPLVLAIGLVEVSAVIITTSMKAMHGKVLQAKKLDICRIIS